MVKLCICMFVYNLYVHMFSYSLMYVNVCVWVGICMYVCSRKQHIWIAHTILYSPSKMQFGGWLISNLWFMGDSLC